MVTGAELDKRDEQKQVQKRFRFFVTYRVHVDQDELHVSIAGKVVEDNRNGLSGAPAIDDEITPACGAAP
jgi:hypothetical protein